MNRRHTTMAMIAMAAILTGCGSSSSETDADVMFAQMMIPHHEQAIELADLALNPATGSSAEVQELARAIKAAQDPEIAFMKEWLTDGGHSLTADDGVDHSSMMKGMLTLEELDSLRQLTGSEFDTAWIEAMIAHHEGAIDMAQTVVQDGDDPEIAALAESIGQSQSSEIEILRSLGS
ncbi:MAG: DUF305 domain-containing protein [Ilumatobacteraceae bacterium]